jgi:ankyrin repeat protein
MRNRKLLELTEDERREAEGYTRRLALLTSAARQINGPNAASIKEVLPNAIRLGPMYDAVTSGKVWRGKLALNDGADPNEPGVFAPTVLHVAAENGWLDIVRLLVECGADATYLDSQGRTPAAVAAASGHSTVARYLESVAYTKRIPEM